MTVNASIFWYDYETTGIDPRRDRPLQIAGIRTDEALNEIGEPMNLYCRPSDDILPHPMACLITGITPQRLAERGLSEADFMTRVHAQLAQPATCVAGYNSLRFDDEVTRYSLYRNFFDPYAREWQGGNSRWDLIDMVRTAYALRPEGIQWPQLDGRLSLKLEMLTAANGLEHGQAHDALSDVRATIALARLIRQRQPRLYDYLYQLRSKHKVLDQVRLLQPLVHVSGRFSAERHFLSVVLPLAWHPRNRNALIVCDLCADPAPLLELSAEDLRRRLYTRRDELAEGELPVPLKQIQVNRCPVVAPLSVLRAEDRQRTGIELEECQRKAELLRQHQTVWADKLTALYGEESFSASDDPEQQLYDGFIGDRDRRLCEQLRLAEPEQLAKEQWPFDDARLQELFFRYRARNFPETLSATQQQQWQDFCRARLSRAEYGAPNTLDNFAAAMEAGKSRAGQCQRSAWRVYGAGRVGELCAGVARALSPVAPRTFRQAIKNASAKLAFFVELTGLAQQGGPAFDGLGAPLGFPLFQSLVVAALGLDDFAGVRVLVLLDLASALGGGGLGGAGALAELGVRIEQGDHVTQGLLVSAHQRAQFLFEFQFFLQFVVLFQGFQALLKFLDGFFRGAIFVDQGHVGYLVLGPVAVADM